jgi:hypothetical protein
MPATLSLFLLQADSVRFPMLCRIEKPAHPFEFRPVNECNTGMVFSINANPDSAKSFAVFQANAEVAAASSANLHKQAPQVHPRDFASAAKIARN